MITVEDLFVSGRYENEGDQLDSDPLRDSEALQEAQILDFRIYAQAATAAVLFELRTSLQFDRGNAGLLVVRGLRSLTWDSSEINERLMALSIVSSQPKLEAGNFSIEIRCHPSSGLILLGSEAEFYVLDVGDIGDVPPDFTEIELKKIKESICLLGLRFVL